MITALFGKPAYPAIAKFRFTPFTLCTSDDFSGDDGEMTNARNLSFTICQIIDSDDDSNFFRTFLVFNDSCCVVKKSYFIFGSDISQFSAPPLIK